jgi:hypothetical protein
MNINLIVFNSGQFISCSMIPDRKRRSAADITASASRQSEKVPWTAKRMPSSRTSPTIGESSRSIRWLARKPWPRRISNPVPRKNSRDVWADEQAQPLLPAAIDTTEGGTDRRQDNRRAANRTADAMTDKPRTAEWTGTEEEASRDQRKHNCTDREGGA